MQISTLLLLLVTLVAPEVARAVEPAAYKPEKEEAPFDEWAPDRRKDQVATTPGHILTPAFADIPGIGLTYGILGGLFKVEHTETDVLGFKFWGDLAGAGISVLSLKIPYLQEVFLDLNVAEFSKAGIESNRRGIHSSREQRKLVELNDLSLYYAQVTWKLFARRLSLQAGGNQQSSRLNAIRDKEGALISSGEHEKQTEFNHSFGTFLDLTDDRPDPRRGLSAEMYRYERPPPSSRDPTFYQVEENVLGYIPVGHFSTWVFNAYKADAVVTSPGDTDPDSVRRQLNFGCGDVQDATQKASCETTEKQFVDETVASNKYGTAPGLGGTQRLRSYVTNRYYAAHTLALGTEFRWNLTEEFTPFNIFVASGVRTGIQTAFFMEGGTVADQESNLLRDWRYSYGTGIRFILASGFVVRLDLATGSEGTQPTVIFQYPWMLF